MQTFLGLHIHLFLPHVLKNDFAYQAPAKVFVWQQHIFKKVTYEQQYHLGLLRPDSLKMRMRHACKSVFFFCMRMNDYLLKKGTEKLHCCNNFSLYTVLETKNASARTRSRLVLPCSVHCLDISRNVFKIQQTGDFIPCR